MSQSAVQLNYFLLTILAVLAPSISNASNIETNAWKFKGEAFHPNTGKLLYTESYYQLSNQSTLVRYKDTNSKLIAEKTLVNSQIAYAPLLLQTNFFTGENIVISVQETNNAEIDGPDVRSEYIVQYQKSSQHRKKSTPVSITNQTVIDAGFVSYIQSNWDQLLEGNQLEFNYLVPSRAQSVNLKINRRIPESESEFQFKLEADSWVLRMLLDPIILTFDRDRRLKRFQGRGNIAMDELQYLVVDIRYSYANGAPSS